MAILEEQPRGRRGLLASLTYDRTTARSALTVPAGIVVVPDTAEGSCKVPASAADVSKALGLVEYSPTEQPDAVTGNEYRAKSMVSIVKRGIMWATVEAAVSLNTVPFVRFSGSNPGQLLPNSGPAGIVVTPSAVNSTRYFMAVKVETGLSDYVVSAEYTSDSDATAAEIATGLAAVFDADPNITAAEDTGTLVLTSATAFLSVVESDANIAITSDGQVAFPLRNSFFRTATSGAGIAKVELKS